MKRNLKWLWLSIFVILLDQTSKYFALKHLTLDVPYAVMPSLNFTLTYNRGAAFAFLRNAGGWQMWLFSGLALVIAILIVTWLSRLRPPAAWFSCALSLILGGAIGNLIDRIIHGHVIDFIDAYYKNWHWYDFNLADSAIVIGAFMIVISLLWE